MKKFIFDLDFTLYNKQDHIEDSSDMHAFYKSFKRKPVLINLLQELKEQVYIFTNGNTEHAKEVLKRLGVSSFFPDNKIISRDDILYLKPNRNGYYKVIFNFNISYTDEVYFFEDTVENLVTAKKFGWKTILIGDNIKNYSKYVDYKFPSIEEALVFFIVMKKFEKNVF